MNKLNVLCESLMVMHLVLSDEETFIKNKTKFIPQPDETIFQSFCQAGLIIDKIITQPFIIPKLKDILGVSFFELFKGTFEKLTDSKWIEFGVESYIPENIKERTKKMIDFVNEYTISEQSIMKNSNIENYEIPPPYDMMVYSKDLNMPLFSNRYEMPSFMLTNKKT